MNEDLFELRIPHSSDAEQAVIGSMLIDPACISDVMNKTSTDDFYTQTNRDVFEVISAMHQRSNTIDPVTIVNEMKKIGSYRDDTQSYMMEIMTVTPTAANVMKYVEILNNETMKRNILTATAEATEKIRSGENPQSVCFYLQGESERIAERQAGNDLISGLSACSDFYSYITSLGSGKCPYVRSGYTQLDYILGGGFVNEGLYILAARPGCGKTTIGLQIADKVAKSGIPTLFMSLEMSKNQITAKRVAVETGINYTKVITGELEQSELTKVSEACGKLSNVPLVINRRSSATVDDIGFLARQVKGLGFIVIDYLGLIQNRNGKSLYEKVTDTSNNLKRLSRALGVPILCLAQLNREVEGRGGKPRVSDLRDSGAIEQDADGILLLSRDMENAADSDSAPTELCCMVGKNRHGRTGEMKFAFYLTNGRILPVRENT